MKSAVTLLALASFAASAWAGEIEGKWGLGVDSGLLRSGGVLGALIFAPSARTAWLLDVKAAENMRDVHGSGVGIYLPSGGTDEFTQSVAVVKGMVA
jgi:hypothetical protein